MYPNQSNNNNIKKYNRQQQLTVQCITQLLPMQYVTSNNNQQTQHEI